VLLEARDISKSYKRGQKDFWAVDKACLSMNTGDFVCITGASGSGKSTLVSMLAGLLPPTSGDAFFDGVKLASLGDAALSRLRNSEIGYIPQGHSILANFTVLDNVRLPFYLHKRGGDPAERAAALLGQVGILPLAGQYPAQLSGGELRRVSIARGLINAPKLLIADEPTGDLDPENAERIVALFSEIARAGTAVLVVTHSPEHLQYCTRHYAMSAGVLREATGG
jgi:putative ABC transport system ATP-binding protein